MTENRRYAEIANSCEKFERDRRVESLAGLIPQARLYDYGFRSLVGPLEVIRASIWEARARFRGEHKWHLKQALDQLDQLEILRQLEVPNDFRAITVHFALHHKALRSVKANLERACAVSKFELGGILRKFTRAVQSVTGSNGLYVANWKELEDWKVLHIPDIGVEVVKLVYANRHSLNLGTTSNKLSAHKHRETSEIHFSLEPSCGDEIVGRYRVHVAEPFAVPIKPGEWHGAEPNETSCHHRLLFLTGSPQLLGWGIINDRTATESSKLLLTSLGQDQIQKTGGLLLERAIQDVEHQATSKALEKELIDSSSSGGLTLSVIAIPDSWTTFSHDAINLVVRGDGELTALMNKTKVGEGDAFAIPFGTTYELKNKRRRPLVLLRSILENPRISRVPSTRSGSARGRSSAVSTEMYRSPNRKPFNDLSSAPELSTTHQAEKAIFGCEGSAHRSSSCRRSYLVNPIQPRDGHGPLGRGLLRSDGNSPVHQPLLHTLRPINA